MKTKQACVTGNLLLVLLFHYGSEKRTTKNKDNTKEEEGREQGGDRAGVRVSGRQLRAAAAWGSSPQSLRAEVVSGMLSTL